MTTETITTVDGVALPPAAPLIDPAAYVVERQRFMKYWSSLLKMAGIPQIAGAERAANWAELMTPQTTDAFFIGYSDEGRRESMIPTIFGGFNSERAFEEFIGRGVFSSEGWNVEKTGHTQRDERAKGFLKRFTHVEYAKGFIVERKMIDDNLTHLAFDDARELGDSAFRKREHGAASVFNNAFTDEGENEDGMPIQGPDGVGLCSTAHPRSQDDGTVQVNEGTLALTKGNVGITRRAMNKFTDDRGDIMKAMGDQIMVPPELEDDLLVISKSMLDPTSANNAVNPQQGRFQNIVWHYLTDENAWFMMDSARRKRALRWFDRIPLEFGPELTDRETRHVAFDAYMRYSYGWVDWSWVYGQNPG